VVAHKEPNYIRANFDEEERLNSKNAPYVAYIYFLAKMVVSKPKIMDAVKNFLKDSILPVL